MINKIQSTPSFGSTQIKVLPAELKWPIHKVTDKYLSVLKRDSFSAALKHDIKGNPATPQMIANNIKNTDVALDIIFDKNHNAFINVFGKNSEIDKKIGDILTKLFDNAKFTKDIK